MAGAVDGSRGRDPQLKSKQSTGNPVEEQESPTRTGTTESGLLGLPDNQGTCVGLTWILFMYYGCVVWCSCGLLIAGVAMIFFFCLLLGLFPLTGLLCTALRWGWVLILWKLGMLHLVDSPERQALFWRKRRRNGSGEGGVWTGKVGGRGNWSGWNTDTDGQDGMSGNWEGWSREIKQKKWFS